MTVGNDFVEQDLGTIESDLYCRDLLDHHESESWIEVFDQP